MLSEDERKAIEFFKECIIKDHLFEEDFTLYNMKIFLNFITKLQKEVEHQKEKRENQKVELSILNEKQKEMNKLKNTASSYCGMFRKQEREIRKLQKENEKKDKRLNRQFKLLNKKDKEIGKKDKIIDLMAEQLAGLTIWNNEKEEPLILTDKEDVIKYFKEIAERKSEEC